MKELPRPRINPRPIPPDRDPKLHPNPQPQQSLVEEMGELVDEIRQLNTDFGMNPYRVFSIVERYTGGEIGRGDIQVISEVEILPTPKVDMSPISSDARSAGTVERGTVDMWEISPRYTEEDIKTIFNVQPLPAGDIGYLEVRMDARQGSATRLRFTIQRKPWLDAENFQWRAQLSAQDEARSRDGQTPDVQMHRFDGG